MRFRYLLGALAAATAALAAAALAGSSSSATAGPVSCAGNGNGYTYAGHQSGYRGHGIRATITPLRVPSMAAGHVASWVGVGGPGQGANGEDAWIQVGIARVAGGESFIYAEITRAGTPELRVLETSATTGRSHSFAVLEMRDRRDRWRVWVDGQPVTEPIHVKGSSGRWAPIATAETFNGGQQVCNRFSFRFERVSISYGAGGSWRPFVSAHRFLDANNRLKQLAEAPPSDTARPLPYAVLATSAG